MAPLTHLLAASLALLTASASSVKDLTPSNFDEIVLHSGKPALVEFFAPWCGHCKTLAPIYDELASHFASVADKVTIAKVDADAEKDLGRRFGVQGFPTLKWFDGVSEEPEDYKSGRDLESLTRFVEEKTGVKARAKRVERTAVDMLNDRTFGEQIGGDVDALVAFTAPWCGHCKTLAPTWEKVAQDFAAESGVLIAKVDCEADNAKATAQDAGVKSYPTIHYYPKGSKDPIPYTGGRSEADLVSFMNEKAGTHRSVGGTLNALAGTIPSLDDMAKTLKSGGETAYQQFVEAVGAVSGKYGEYYGRVAKKSGENAGYVEKELARLQGLLAKGGLAPEKLDDLTSRSNILRKFVGGEEVRKDEL
ncbi:hypothetical protein LTR91_019956 [Friedmanniomyces endolithicus]|uniref:protein disulfide-isomerase n=1 Tax=Friedmanniomyces endolithicus TaxID=329885 RepID=A0AAN6HCY0_9PEZI|nr:hypothetical protein LTR94_021837 [Friedmanniomyces endolithicus]KAK0769036.1 hypothetical protein LTR59_017269 [Friedmanniomyces endolithicus]KAK0785270.1 hypothetical protein LTR75_013571 [Friedmanniomyces endolithicus]KAK0792893.1 hypothetical protein LTR38_009754 [Friedmanniomyces endolithicus]KAK0836264.1 hypothetical protein LTR03_013838 [Friedmanniomyces endolithicus]